jgi:2-dehydro-3-deoxygluconokinase
MSDVGSGPGSGGASGFDIVAMGEPMVEYNQLPPDPDGRRRYLEGHGGDTSNAAIAAARQGARVAYATAIGADAAGDSFLALWRREGVDTSLVRRDGTRPTAVYFVTHDDQGGHAFAFYRTGSAASAYATQDVPEATIAGARFLYASGISLGISPAAADAVLHAIAVARAAGVAVAFDTNYRARLWPPARAAAVIHAAAAASEIVLPTIDDARILTGLGEPQAVLDFYLRLGARVVALKMGAAGAWLATEAGRVAIAAHPSNPVDATGAGDTFAGCLLARLVAGDSPEAAARYAAVAAALSTEGYGAVAPIPHAAAVRAALRTGS